MTSTAHEDQFLPHPDDVAQAQPKRRPYNASASLSEYGIFPECDAAPVAEDSAKCVGCEGKPSGDNVPCVVCGADSAKGAEPDIQEKLKDPNVVHMNMLRGTIAPITFDQLAHILGDEATANWIADRQQRGGDVEAVLRRFLTGDGFIAECDIPHIVATLTVQPAVNGYTCTVPDDCETLHWRGQILSMNELASVAQPGVGEEIHVHIEGQDVLTLPLQRSGTDMPRFVVHVPGAHPVPAGVGAQPTASAEPSDEEIEALAHRVCTKYTHADGPSARRYEFGMLTLRQFARALLSRYGRPAWDAQPVACEELLPCPFCGSSAHFSASDDVVNVRCDNWNPGKCLGAGPNCYTQAEAMAGWNRRAAPVAAQKADDARDAERYRFIRDVPHSDLVHSVLTCQQNSIMDEVIDAAIAQQRKGE